MSRGVAAANPADSAPEPPALCVSCGKAHGGGSFCMHCGAKQDGNDISNDHNACTNGEGDYSVLLLALVNSDPHDKV